ncbi:sarcosine oxidase subunit delta [Vibrio sp.]|uniref:Sarcosine oxidase subunit delta family protein n=1 Tax=Vibrio viridaestus TaxID=2487322 RepID=A0A3N9TDB8_9VIBR|nr:sarcosine oxidase subunit delta [Vibrio viridaestus]MDC0610153.1 sarcosine oxidase subunit delta [Vibrio sp.]RQW62187.1 sarcosine oxidase subunit delta family protein [Vibrio viridaestus]
MFYVYCPHCGEMREEEEFQIKGQAHISRPADPDNCSDKEWGEYMYFRSNPKGPHNEIWYHATGCRKFFNVTRDTATYEIKLVYKLGEKPETLETSIQGAEK